MLPSPETNAAAAPTGTVLTCPASAALPSRSGLHHATRPADQRVRRLAQIPPRQMAGTGCPAAGEDAPGNDPHRHCSAAAQQQADVAPAVVAVAVAQERVVRSFGYLHFLQVEQC